MLLISNSFQYTSIWNKKGLIFDSAKSYNNSVAKCVTLYVAVETLSTYQTPPQSIDY